jgi:hypothetical protein
MDDHGNAPVGRIERRVWLAELHRGVASHLRDMFVAHAVSLDEATRSMTRKCLLW